MREVIMGLARGSRPVETEKGFLAAVIALAQACGWKVYHQRPAWTARGWRTALQGDAGYPDLTLCKAGEPVIYAELKRDNGRVTAAQAAWLQALRQARGTEVYCWRPAEFAAIVARLQGGRR